MQSPVQTLRQPHFISTHFSTPKIRLSFAPSPFPVWSRRSSTRRFSAMSCTKSRRGSVPHEPLASIASRVHSLCEETETLMEHTGHHEKCIIGQLHRFDAWAASVDVYSHQHRTLEERLRQFSPWLPYDTLEMLHNLELNLITLADYVEKMQDMFTPVEQRGNLGKLICKTKVGIIHGLDSLDGVKNAIDPHDDEDLSSAIDDALFRRIDVA
ncbi:hypothetical protein ASPVEDRAFT_876993 [Aspergillus versicolor CBS 583.65]|uniref:Uncharacterized protein n=1 Tax=Aspergillus versicolor CBS 583.65 TaxID=1036611 RepID=A0A1L9Q0C7_ASPVE|nr:uncharacterized protein ASPVEDRAFT_876993 [Aspergillus versicolor CBS 583.65]OJJ07223.1 hypothetical protein ASPVEDRAFT_876993 [Aspergillus versicolor CBS 583.65]